MSTRWDRSMRCKRTDQSAAAVVCLMSPPANEKCAFTYVCLQRTDRSQCVQGVRSAFREGGLDNIRTYRYASQANISARDRIYKCDKYVDSVGSVDILCSVSPYPSVGEAGAGAGKSGGSGQQISHCVLSPHSIGWFRVKNNLWSHSSEMVR